MNYRIPFNKPCLTGDELRYVADAISRGHIAGDGVYSGMCRELLERELGAAGVLLTTSCTHALEMAALLLDIGPGDEIIVPSFTFVSTVNAFVLRGARPVFADIRRDTLNLDEAQLPALITPRTRAILPVHYAGVACEMDAILRIAGRRGIPIVEDNAHGLFARYRGRYLGAFGALATQSFHETKNLICGEGGALVINEPEFLDRAEVLREKGTNRSRYYRGQVDKYTWVDLGSSYLPSDILAAFLLAQLQNRTKVLARRKAIWDYYHHNLRQWAARFGVQQPSVPPHCEQAYHMYYLLLPSLADRQALIEHLRARGILAVFHYVPLHLSEMGISFGGREGACPVTEWASDRLVRLPFYNDLTESEQNEVIEAVTRFEAVPRVAAAGSPLQAA
ncbi:MAG: dTDP-4-amino-4,6-dideoxygalactose transaminase [Acidobacteriia bacterium]|nr:dTDP-4-amino-4,6-dideoxygalactose transaminase [Terriglobia bacterium]